MTSYKFLLDLALILISTKLLGLISSKFKMPQVVGALLAGLVLGPAFLGLISETTFIESTAEVGVIVLMFCAGLETDVKELKKCGKASLVIAILGVMFPLFGGFGAAWFFIGEGRILSDAGSTLFLQCVFIGVILTATSVSITVETLKELGKLKTRSGNAILGAAIIDDIIGIVALTIVTSMADSGTNIGLVLGKIVAYFLFAGVAGFLFFKGYSFWCEKSKRGLHRHAIIAFAFCLLMSYTAEHYFGVADITGAFIAGLIISKTEKSEFLTSKFDVLSYLYLSPIFFASIGIKVMIPEMSAMVVWFAVALVLVAIFTKIIGCGIGAKICKYKNYQAIRIGVGMISRGEVALIVAAKGEKLGLISSDCLGPVVLVVVITTIVTPILLKPVFKLGPTTIAVKENEGVSKKMDQVDVIREQ